MSSNLCVKVKGYASYDAATIKSIRQSEEQYLLLLKLYNHNKQQAKNVYAKAPEWALVKSATPATKHSRFFNLISDIRAVLTWFKRSNLSTVNNS